MMQIHFETIISYRRADLVMHKRQKHCLSLFERKKNGYDCRSVGPPRSPYIKSVKGVKPPSPPRGAPYRPVRPGTKVPATTALLFSFATGIISFSFLAVIELHSCCLM